MFFIAFSLVLGNVSNAQNINFPKSSDRIYQFPKTGFNLNTQKNLIIPAALISYGFLSLTNTETKEWNSEIRAEIMEDHPNFHTKADNYLQFSPAAITFALKASGFKGQNNMWTSAKIYATSSLLMAGTVFALKSITGEQRPDFSGNNSFPSGHTATAFAAAEFMHQEFKKSSVLLSYSGYVAASATGSLRMLNNKHYLSDVLAGAGIGILTTKGAYWLNNKFFNSHKRKR
ncbi:hypothetical protein A5893_05605 [Pedobacter psychrophilus]|uniref:Phosphatidic acid phosphatase type 2/haloperoxidase domain-containing protein n=1 Tax=Pedobacter psychrophilus TaxID=1826909 RepID=A0A179DHQ4_9SPHI|nr:hypothetical protein A5893_05605 [Pedobacter psychrophilus]